VRLPSADRRLNPGLVNAPSDGFLRGEEALTRAFEFAFEPEELAQTSIGPYTLIEKIGEGGFGVVWMAQQQEPMRRTVALKIIKSGMDTRELIARFAAERQALALMDHPNIARVFDAGATSTGRPFFVMELVRGAPVTRYCDEARLTTQARLRLFLRVCLGVQHAHQKGIIHRDLKPSNILVSLDGGEPIPKIIDFGVAKALGSERLTDRTLFTRLHTFVGTPVYTSPEQIEMSGLNVDTRSDVYSLGVLLYELVTGCLPFDPEQLAKSGLAQARRTILETDPLRPSRRWQTLSDDVRRTSAAQRGVSSQRVASLLSGELDWIIMRCLEKDRNRRYETTAALADDIRRHLENEPVAAGPPRATYRLSKLIRRHRVVCGAAAAVTAAILLGMALTVWQSVRARQAEQLAAAGRSSAEDLLAFVFTDVGVDLTDSGQLALVRQISARALSYYDRLPEGLHTRDTRASQALALAGIGILGREPAQTGMTHDVGRQEGIERLTRAVQVFETLEATGPLTAFMRIAYAASVRGLALQMALSEHRFENAVGRCERAVRIVAPALTDPEWGSIAHEVLRHILHTEAIYLTYDSRNAEAIGVFTRAMAVAEEAIRRRPDARGPRLHAAILQADISRAFFQSGRLDEGRRAWSEAQASLKGFVEREPFLIAPRVALGTAGVDYGRRLAEDWQFAAAQAQLEDARFDLAHVLKLDPKNWTPRMPLVRAAWVQSAMEWAHGNWAAAEAHTRQAIAVFSVDWRSEDSATELAMSYFDLARIFAATGQDAECERALQEGDRLADHIVELRRMTDRLERALHESWRHLRKREVDFQRLQWAAVGRNAEADLANLVALPVELQAHQGVIRFRGVAQKDLARAALAAGDASAVSRHAQAWLAEWRPGTGPGANASMKARHDRLDLQLLRVEALACMGQREEANGGLAEILPEVERLHAAFPEVAAAQVLLARSCLVSALLAVSAEERRAQVQRALDCLRPAAAAGRLTRCQRDVLWANAERQHLQLRQTVAP
jgi:serine/threonine protein kinase/tetratricopeptide (TPR) repeat protein